MSPLFKDRLGMKVWCAARGLEVELVPFLGPLLVDQKTQQELLHLTYNYSNCWMCHGAGGVVGQPVATPAELYANPNAAFKTPTREGLVELLTVVGEVSGKSELSLRDLLPVDTMHLFYKEGLICKLIQCVWKIPVKKKVPGRKWLSTPKRLRAAAKIEALTGHSPHTMFRTSLELRRKLCALTPYALEGLIPKQAQCQCGCGQLIRHHAEHLRAVVELCAVEERSREGADPPPSKEKGSSPAWPYT